ncbi:hypothetical protein PSHT_06833 [Puccinia striiformis]|uniref:Uncharacterized protein n=1 Tax=Puccinia striiformis TaxID=27350 RepID=A0A2S4W313_9BASI|nr:hypothetical protein PSHT_06833 [Puccinia striiformis]
MGSTQTRLPAENQAGLFERLRSIKNSLVGSKARKSLTTTDPSISNDLNILASILESDCLDPNTIKLKIEVAAIVGLISIPEDRAVYALLAAGLPRVIVHSITTLLTNTSIPRLLSCQGPPRHDEHHLLLSLLRTLSSLLAIIQDISSSPRKFGFMNKSHPQRVHLSHHHDLPAPTTSNTDFKGKAKASLIDANQPSNIHIKVKESCIQVKDLLMDFIVHWKSVDPVHSHSQSTYTLHQHSFLAFFGRFNHALLAINLAQDQDQEEEDCLKALIKAIMFWVDSSHDLVIEYGIRTIGVLLSIHDPPSPNHTSQEDKELIAYLDKLVWTHSSNTFKNDSGGVAWFLTRKSQKGSPVLRAALVTSIVSLVNHFPDIRVRILILQIHESIELIDNSSNSILVRCEAAYALAHALTISESLHQEAFDANAIPVLKKLIDHASLEPIPYPTSGFVTQSAMLRESGYLALATLMSRIDGPRKQVITMNLLPGIVESLNDRSILVQIAAAQCCRALSRAISIVRTKLADEGAGSILFDLAFGAPQSPEHLHDLEEDSLEIHLQIIALGALSNLVLEFSPMKTEVLNRNGIEEFIKLFKVSKFQSLRESALWGLKNIIFSSDYQLKSRVITCLGWDEIYKCLDDKNLSIQENMLSFLRNLACGETSDIEILYQQLNNRNLEDRRLIDILEDKLTTLWSSNSIKPLNRSIPDDGRDSSSSSLDQILIQTIYTFSNIATGNLSHKTFILERPNIMQAILLSLDHRNPLLQCAALWCIINLSHFDELTKPKVIIHTIHIFEELGIPDKLREILRDFALITNNNNHPSQSQSQKEQEQEHYAKGRKTDKQESSSGSCPSVTIKPPLFLVKDRAECALIQIMRKKDHLHC